MAKNLFLIPSILFVGAVSASADDKSALYITPPATDADTIKYNISVSPVLKHVGDELVVYVNGQEGRHISLEDGLKLTFGKSILMGDANSDDKVDSADAVAVTEYFIGKTDAIDENKADVNYDGKVTVADANNIVNTTK